jgi:hypothetical protein
MAFQPGQSGNPAGRPAGAKSRVGITVKAQKQLLKAMEQRALDGDRSAQDQLFQYAFLAGHLPDAGRDSA